jgi:hypothetical protein
MAESGASTVMLAGIFEQLAEGHQLPKPDKPEPIGLL